MVTLRPVRPDDREFLISVYASTRTEELAPVPWTGAQKTAFLRMQFDAQDADYSRNYAGADFSVIEVDGVGAGRLYVERKPAEMRLIDIALLPAFRGRGIGKGLLCDLLAEADAQGKGISLYVEVFNPARRLYEGLGFTAVSERSPYVFMERRPAVSAARVS